MDRSAARRGLRRGARGVRRHPGAAGAEGARPRPRRRRRRGGACSTSAAASGSRRCGSRRLAGPGATVAGIDKSADFIADAAARATAAGLAIDFRVGDATALPWADASFDAVRAERLLIYLADWQAAVREMRRVAQARRRARLHRARLLDDDGQPARPVGGAPRARPRGRHRGGRELAAGSAPRLPRGPRARRHRGGDPGRDLPAGPRRDLLRGGRSARRRGRGALARPSSTPGSRGSPTSTRAGGCSGRSATSCSRRAPEAGHVVDAGAAPGMAAQDAAQRQPAAPSAPCVSSASSA